MLLLGVDQHSRWWSAVLAVAARWSLLSDADDGSGTDIETMQCLYAVVDSVPKHSHGSE